MNRNEEYMALLRELEQTPEALETTVDRALERKRRRKKAGRIFGIPATSLAACFVLFMMLVNLFPPFAYACGRIPALKKLAQAVAWSPSLSAAVENEYVQPIEQSQTVGDITATVHYVIVDRKQVNCFYTLEYDKELYESMNANYRFGNLENWSGTSGSGMLEPGKLERIDLDFTDHVPSAIDLTITPYVDETPESMMPVDQLSPFENMEEPVTRELGDFQFHLEFDPYFTEKGETIPVNYSFALDEQTLTLTEVELYPTHLRINLEDGADNLSWLKGLDLYLENERGEQFRKSLNGIVASGDPDGEGMATFWLDSPYFRNSEHLTLYIERAEWKEKDAERILVDLRNNTCSAGLPPGTTFGGAEHYDSGWVLNFIHPYKDKECMYQLFERRFWDDEGNAHDIHGVSNTFGYYDPETRQVVRGDTHFTESFPLEGYHGDTVELELRYNRVTEFEEPIAIPIR